MIHRNEYIFDYVIQRSGVTFPYVKDDDNSKKPFKGFTELSKELKISKARVREIFIYQLEKWNKLCNHKVYHYEDPRKGN